LNVVHTPIYDSGVLIVDTQLINVTGPSCGTYKALASKSRNLVCPAGTLSYGVRDSQGVLQTVCVAPIQQDLCESIGNPILMLSGRKVQRETDAANSGVDFSRYYNSQPWLIPSSINTQIPQTSMESTLVGQFGDHWRSEFDYRLYFLNGTVGKYALSLPHGALVYFDANYRPLTGMYKPAVMSLEDSKFVIKLEGKTLVFRSSGKLDSMISAAGQSLRFAYSGDVGVPISYALNDLGIATATPVLDGLLLEINLSSGKRLYSLNYDISGRIKIVRVNNIDLRYTYDVLGSLVSVTYDNSDWRTYGYQKIDSRMMLRTLTDANGVVFAEWKYHSTGRAYQSNHADNTELFEINFSQIAASPNPNVTVKNPLGKETRYYFQVINGIQKITHVEGVASANCAAADQFRSYYADGTVQTKTDWEGNVTYFERDAYGRTTLEQKGYRWSGSPQFGIVNNVLSLLTPPAKPTDLSTVKTCWHLTHNKPERTIEADRVTIYQYYPDGKLQSEKTEPRSSFNEACL
jgi:Domain of unknown function (DUF6531)